jgi:hypothetical protein
MAGVGQNSEMAPKTGFIKFEFDKEWIGAKGYVPSLSIQVYGAEQ